MRGEKIEDGMGFFCWEYIMIYFRDYILWPNWCIDASTFASLRYKYIYIYIHMYILVLPCVIRIFLIHHVLRNAEFI